MAAQLIKRIAVNFLSIVGNNDITTSHTINVLNPISGIQIELHILFFKTVIFSLLI